MSFPISFFWRASSRRRAKARALATARKARTRVALSPCVSRGFAITPVLVRMCEMRHSKGHYANLISDSILQIGSRALTSLKAQRRINGRKTIYNSSQEQDGLSFANAV